MNRTMRWLVMLWVLCAPVRVSLAEMRTWTDTDLLFVGDFEQRNSLNALGDTGIEHTLKKVEIVSDPVRHGRGALKLTLDREATDDPKAYRTDFWIRGMSQAFEMGEEYWYGFSTLLPDDFEPDALGELFVQWINPSVGGPPSLAIYLYEDQYQIRKRWGEPERIHRTLWRGSVFDDLGQWVDWVFRVRWSDGEDGLVEAWKNGERIISDTGPNANRAGDRAPYFKFGIYKFPWRQSSSEAPSPVTQRTLYIDEIRIGTAEAGYEAVAPPLAELDTGRLLFSGLPADMPTRALRLGRGGGTFVLDGIQAETPEVVWSGVISGDGTLTVSADADPDASLVLTGLNTYAGGTVVQSGTLLVKGLGGSATGTGTVTVKPGARIGGFGRIRGNLHLEAGARIVFRFNNPGIMLRGDGVARFDGLRISHLDGLDRSFPIGVYPVIDGAVDAAGVLDAGPANAVRIGAGKQAYFSPRGTGLDVVVASAQSYGVAYRGNGQTRGRVPSAQLKRHNQPLVLAARGDLFRPGYHMTGWNTRPDGTGTAYREAATYRANEHAVLYAQWVPGVPAILPGIDKVAVTDDEIHVHLTSATHGPIRLLDLEPFDHVNPLRGLITPEPDALQLNLEQEGFLRVTFTGNGGGDPRIHFPRQRVNSDYVDRTLSPGQFEMLTRRLAVKGYVESRREGTD